MRRLIVFIASIICVIGSCAAAPPQFGPDGKPAVPVTSQDTGPDIDPQSLVEQRYSAVPLFRTFRSFVGSAYATAKVWVYADGDDEPMYASELVYTYPRFYTPTWREMFDSAARQLRGKWEWNPQNRQFKFERTNEDPAIGVKLAKDWRRQDRGLYVWHAPRGLPMGMDIYFLGHYTADAKQPDLIEKARAHAAMFILGQFPAPPKVETMQRIRVASGEALYARVLPRPGVVWRQWALVKDGNAFLIVSALPEEKEGELSPVVDEMVRTFGPLQP
jgi:hypothetical protein